MQQSPVKVLIMPRDERMKALISLKAFGLTELDAVRHYIAMILADRGVVSAPNMAIGQPFNIGSAVPTAAVGQFTTPATPPHPPASAPSQ